MIRNFKELEPFIGSGKSLYYESAPSSWHEVVVTGYCKTLFSTELELLEITKPIFDYDLYSIYGEIYTNHTSYSKITITFPCTQLYGYNPTPVATKMIDPNDLLKGLVSK